MAALQELQSHLDAGAVPQQWKDDYAPTGDLRPLWDTEWDAFVLMQLAARIADPRALVRAACACARTTFSFLPENDERTRQAVEAAESWAEGTGSADDARARLAGLSSAPATSAAADASACCAMHVVQTIDQPEFAADVITQAVEAYVASVGDRDGTSGAYEDRLAALADIVRSVLPCPTLEALLAATPPM